jgi:hypothetical protein
MSLLHRNDWRELAVREGDGLEISLYWSKSADLVKVCVLDRRREKSFDIHVSGPDAVGAFYHPFAYAAGRGLLFDLAVSASLDLQLQS